MAQEASDRTSSEPRRTESTERGEQILHPTIIRISELLANLGLKVFIIGARSIIIHGVDLGRETRDWDIIVDKPFTPELRDSVTRILRKAGYKVQWRKWGFLVSNDIHVDINYAPLTFDEDFIARSLQLLPNILLPSLEDIIVLKLMSGERKDIEDLKKILRQSWPMLDKEYLFKRARDTGLERALRRLVRRLGLA